MNSDRVASRVSAEYTATKSIGHSAIAMAAMFFLCSCERAPSQAKLHSSLLPDASSEDTQFSKYAPENPYTQKGPALLERLLFETAGPNGVRIELRDLMVVPSAQPADVSFPGPAVLQVLSGEGSIVIGDKSQHLATGETITLAQNATSKLETHGTAPFVLRARIFNPG